MKTDEALSKQFKDLYDEWGAAIARQDIEWIGRHFALDFRGSAHPWPTLQVNRAQMLDLNRQIETMDVRWLTVTAQRFGNTVLASGVVEYTREAFATGAKIGEGMPTGDELSELVNGKCVLYTGAWRESAGQWQLFDHHMVGIVDGFER
jgi:hypothetical protein